MKNPMLTMIAGLVVGLLAGIGVGLVVAPDDGAPRPGVSQQPDQPIEPEAPEEPLADSGETETAPADESLTRQESRTLQDIIAEADIPAIPTGDAAITGKVLTEDDEPVAGVSIEVSSRYPESRFQSELPIEERMRLHLRYEKWIENSRRHTETDAEGTYRIDGLDEETSYSVRASKPNWNLEPNRGRHSNVHAPAECDYVAMPETSVEVRVQQRDGTTFERFNLSYKRTTDDRHRSTNSGGPSITLELEPGEWQVRATAGYHTEYRSEVVTFEVEAGRPSEPVTVILEQLPGIIGRIEMPEGYTYDGRGAHDLLLQANPGSELPTDLHGNDEAYTQAATASDDEGVTYRFNDVEPGRYRIIVKYRWAVIAWTEVNYTGGVLEENIRVEDPPPEHRIGLRIFDPQGEPVTEAWFDMEVKFDRMGWGGRPYPWVSEDGTFWILRTAELTPHDYGDPQYYLITIRARGAPETEIKYDADWTHVLDVHLKDAATLKLTVTNQNDHPARDRLSWALERADIEEPPASPFWMNRSPGQVSPITFDGIQPGDYYVILNVRAFQDRAVELLRQRVELVSGENTISISIPELHTLRVKVDESIGERPFLIEGVESHFRVSQYSVRVENGVVTFDYIPEGVYRLTGERGVMTVRVPQQSEVDFNPEPFDCLELQIESRNGRITGLGLRDGDKVVEIDGVEVTDAAADKARLEAAYLKDATTWVVLREGARVAVAFSGTELHGLVNGGAGESLEAKPAMRD